MKSYSLTFITAGLLAALLSLVAPQSFAQGPAIEWQKSFGGYGDDVALKICKTTDGGYVAAGYSTSANGDVTGSHGGRDFWVVKISETGTLEWQKALGGTGDDEAHSVQQTFDGGYIVGGYSNSSDFDVTSNYGRTDYWVVKLSEAGDIQWQKSYGGSLRDELTDIKQTADSGFILAGYSFSNDSDVTGHHADSAYNDEWIVKLSKTGAIEWEKSLGSSSYDYASSVQQTTDGGYIVAGYSGRADGDVTTNNGSLDFWIVKLGSTGNIVWQRSYGGYYDDVAIGIKQTTDGGYIAVGYSFSQSGNVTENKGAADYWIVKMSSTGTLQWQRSYGSSGQDVAFGVDQNADGSYIVAGYTNSNNGDVTGNHGLYDYWVLKLSSTGGLLWQKTLGGTSADIAYSIVATSDSGLIAAGESSSADNDVSLNHGGSDFWITKLAAASGTPDITIPKKVVLSPNPTEGTITVTNIAPATIKVYNSIGMLVKEAWATNTISIRDQPSGYYIVRLFDETGQPVFTSGIIKR